MPPKRGPSTIELGSSGLRTNYGRINEEQHRDLMGIRGARTFEEMATNDATVGAVLYSIEAFLRKVEWEVEPADESEAAEKQANFLRDCLADMDAPWNEFISDVLSFLVYGYSLHEIIYKIREDGRFGWRALACRPQSTIDRWDIEPSTGTILGAHQKVPSTGAAEVYLPIDRCILFRTRAYKNNPEGRSILRNAFRSWRMKRRLEEIEAIGIERDLNGLPVITVPAEIMSTTASAAQRSMRATMETLASQIKRNEREGLVFPSAFVAGETGVNTGYGISLLSGNGAHSTNADPVIRRYDARIAMTMCAEFIILGTEKQGSFALGSEKSANFIRSLHWYVQTIAATLNKTAVARLYEVNGVPKELRARICPGDLDSPDLGSFGQMMQSLISSGVLHPTPAMEERVRELIGLPQEEDELERLFEEVSPQPTGNPFGGSPRVAEAPKPEPAEATPPADNVDNVEE